MISLKREIQFLRRKAVNLLKRQRLEDPYIVELKKDLSVPAPSPFQTALFNFTIDFELVWGNGNLGNIEHRKENRIQSGNLQHQNFRPFLKMLDDLKFPITWAVLGKLANPTLSPEKELEFKPQWATRSWYDEEYLKNPSELWSGQKYLKAIQGAAVKHEIMSHGFSHIDYADSATTEAVANWDMKNGIEELRKLGFSVNGFVFPCNKHAHGELLRQFDISIIRGENSGWSLDTDPMATPIGFWISPAFYTFKEIKELMDYCVEKKSFFHPWMHLIECDLRQRDIENFYLPMFSYVKELQEKGLMRNISFQEISKEVSAEISKGITKGITNKKGEP